MGNAKLVALTICAVCGCAFMILGLFAPEAAKAWHYAYAAAMFSCIAAFKD